MASLLAAGCQHSAAAFGLHACAESVRLGAAPAPRLIGALWQSNPPLYYATARWCVSRAMRTAPQPLLRLISNLLVYATLAHRVKKASFGVAGQFEFLTPIVTIKRIQTDSLPHCGEVAGGLAAGMANIASSTGVL